MKQARTFRVNFPTSRKTSSKDEDAVAWSNRHERTKELTDLIHRLTHQFETSALILKNRRRFDATPSPPVRDAYTESAYPVMNLIETAKWGSAVQAWKVSRSK